MTISEASPMPVRQRRWLRLADRPIRSKLTLLVALPLAAIRVKQAYRLVSIGVPAGELTAKLQRERAATAAVFADSGRPAAATAYRQQAAVTDAAADRFVAGRQNLDVPSGLATPLRQVNEQLAGLPLLQEQVPSSQDATDSSTTFKYRALTADLGGYRTAPSQLGVDAETANGLRAASMVSQAVGAGHCFPTDGDLVRRSLARLSTGTIVGTTATILAAFGGRSQ